MDYLELTVTVQPEAVEAAADILRRYAQGGVAIEPPFEAIDEDGGVEYPQRSPVAVRAWLPCESDELLTTLEEELHLLGDSMIRSLSVREVKEEAWADSWRQYFQVMRVGQRIVLRPSWREYEAEAGDIVVVLDPGQAFGTGQHETTRLCLAALEDHVRTGARVLDVGCGSGVLSITAALLGAARVDAVDVDVAAVRATEANAGRNGVADVVTVAQGSLSDAWPFEDSPAGRYGLVLANISARVIQELARSLIEAIAPGGLALVSGIVDEREQETCQALENAGGQIVGRRAEGDWRLLETSRRG